MLYGSALENVRYLSMQSKEEWTVLNVVEVEAINAHGEVESTDEGTFISEQRTVDEICRGTVL